ncbi:Pr6Pr family membrane protein [Mycolicibacterium austroafricanum]|uniref:Pr6Pr family membrane protein n=1 Tax=Mycolicibacterium austroafricanum TaxID=39687 RepID=UPI001CA318B5|nr:Pr6Pr family membrane protein [Mycolicibacterium austroafricanum]QZT64889.1 Pr6Pr family membrane protein [Mycolicibacterium austroafricanum]
MSQLAPTQPTYLRTVLRSAIIACVVAALLLVELTSGRGVGWRLITFTYQANLLAAAFYLWTLISPRADARVGLRGAAVLYVVMAGVIWNLFLTEHSMGYTPANLLLHVAVPVLALSDWLLVGRGVRPVAWWQPVAWLAYPAAYLALALLVLNDAGRRAPYYFLDPGSVGPTTVAVNVGALSACVLAFGYTLSAVHRGATAVRADIS